MSVKRNMLTRFIMACGIVLLVGGCGTDEPDFRDFKHSDVTSPFNKDDQWAKVPALRRIPVSSDLFLARSVRPAMPERIASKRISLRLTKGNATIADLIGIMDYEGIAVIARPVGSSGAADELNDIVLPFRRFDGTLGGLATKLSRSLDVAVWWENDALMISDRDRYIVSVPQNQDVIDSVVGELEDFGAEDVTPSLYGGRIVYNARPQLNDEVIKSYLSGLAGNLAEITIQLAVIQLNLTKDAERGFDWSSFQLQFGNPANAPTGALIKGGGLGSATGLSGALSSTSRAAGSGVIGGTYTTTVGDNNVLGVGGAIYYLSQFGRTTTRQMVELRTLAGMPVQLRSGRSTPYIKSIGATTTPGSAGSGNVTSSTDTDTVKTGLTLSLTPYYDSMMGLVIIDVNIEIASITRFVVLNTAPVASTTSGSTSGTSGTTGTTGTTNNATATNNASLSQPETQSNILTDIARVPAGDVVILGGVREETASDNRTAPFGEYESIGSKKTSNENTLIFFILRPVVTIYEPTGAAVAATLPGAPVETIERAGQRGSKTGAVEQIRDLDAVPELSAEDAAIIEPPASGTAKNTRPKSARRDIKPDAVLSTRAAADDEEGQAAATEPAVKLVAPPPVSPPLRAVAPSEAAAPVDTAPPPAPAPMAGADLNDVLSGGFGGTTGVLSNE